MLRVTSPPCLLPVPVRLWQLACQVWPVSSQCWLPITSLPLACAIKSQPLEPPHPLLSWVCPPPQPQASHLAHLPNLHIDRLHFHNFLQYRSFFKKYFKCKFIYLFICLFVYLFVYFWLSLCLRCCAWVFSSCGEQGLLFVAMRGLLIAVASLVEEHGL